MLEAVGSEICSSLFEYILKSRQNGIRALFYIPPYV